MNVITKDHITVGREIVHVRVSSAESGGELLAIDVRMPAGGGPPMLHRHGPAELYRVESGELTIYLEDESGALRRHLAGPGAAVFVPGGREHTVRNESDADATASVVFTPGEQMERFVRAAGELAAAHAPSPEEMREIAAAHGIELTRPVSGTVGR
ncbi:cupin domain-containing protein [Conexibacter stalactiti]|uniref:Cupin domain-containing protein n=1 Tax=Conexibacter stalactiti TaxID=1940611 RepID=A0ABU4HZT8_9ACTN|nr:cupin domain-containing protein [Conexibacter stalactiti]MDW5598823.1 cupin domain-containing protein [Conexibacter stalactiti]MEC5039465.1 cupin domain-containing protein [Conexibacter stalactiti]